MNPARQSVAVCLAGLPIALLALEDSFAGEFAPEVLITAETNDNPRLRSDELAELARDTDGPASRLIAEARLPWTTSTPRGQLAFEPAVRSDAYVDTADEPLESTDVFLRGRGQRRWQRAALGFSLDLSRQRVLATEFLDPQPGAVDDPLDVDGTLLGLNEIRTRAVFSPYTQIEFGLRSAIRLDLRATDVTYDDALGLTNRTDFTDWEAGAAYLRELSPRTTVSTRLFGERFDAVATPNEANTVGIEVGLARELSSIWSIVATVGVEQRDFTYIDSTATRVFATENDFVADLGLRKQTERTSLALDLRRRAFPDSFGFLVTRSELRGTILRDLSPRLRGGVTLRVIGSDTPGGTPDVSRDYGRVGLTLEWAFQESWSLVAGYEHYYWTNQAIDYDARSNSVLVGLNYRKSSRPSVAQ